MERVDRLYTHCKELVTLADGPPRGARRGAALRSVGLVEDGAVAVREGRIVACGPTGDVLAAYRADREIDLSGYVVLPGFVDCHTHPVFVGTREEEFHMRCAGANYMEIAARGGGILSSMRSVREASPEQLEAAVRRHLDGFLAHGTTTVEAKSGYGLSTADELKSLRALEAVRRDHPITVHRTFLGAHEFPPEYREDREAYVELVVEEMLPAVVAEDLCDSCDVFCEPGVFDREQSRRILERARELGLSLRMHVDELEPLGGAELAVELGAASADHLARVSLEGQEMLARSETTAVLLPGTTEFLGSATFAPGRRMLDLGCAVALATDFNPGSCYTQSMTLIMTLACVHMALGPEELVHACTINPAASLGLDDEIGTLHPGKRADLVVLDVPGHRALGYVFGGNPVVMTVKDGEPAMVHARGPEADVLH